MSNQTPKPSPLIAQRERRLNPEPLPSPPDLRHIGDGAARAALLRGEQPTTEARPDPAEVLPGGLTRAAYADLRRTNPVLAARYALANGLYDRQR